MAGIAREADLSAGEDSAELRDALDPNSTDFLDFVIDRSQRSGVDVPDTDAPQLTTLAGVVRYLAQH
jgi:acyl carrier protein